MHSGYHSSGMVISGTCTTEYETGSDDGLGVEGADEEVEGSTGIGVILLFLVAGPSEVTVTSSGSSVTPSMGTATGGVAGGV